MARLTSSGLFCNFTIGATSVPTSTQVGNLITHIYKQVYTVLEINYSSDDSTDTESIVDSDEMFAVLASIITEMVDGWHYSGLGQPKPSFMLDKKDIAKVKEVARSIRMVAGTIKTMDTVRVWGEDTDDQWYVGRSTY